MIILLLAALCAILLLTVGALRYQVDNLTTELTAADTASISQGVGGLETNVEESVIALTGVELVFPIAGSDYRLTSPEGVRVSPLTHTIKNHTGLDIGSVWKAQVVSVADGEVISHWPPPDGYYKGHDVYGGLIVIQHDNGLVSLYAHLSESYIHLGDRVRAGQVIGRVGNTGRSEGAHLHFELQLDDQYLNPLLYFREEDMVAATLRSYPDNAEESTAAITIIED